VVNSLPGSHKYFTRVSNQIEADFGFFCLLAFLCVRGSVPQKFHSVPKKVDESFTNTFDIMMVNGLKSTSELEQRLT
jgi:hypothetical protein